MAPFQACLRAPFGTIGISATDTHVTGIRYLSPDVPALAPKKNTIAFLACVQLQAYLEDPAFEFDMPLRLSGTHHQLAVWEAMRAIPAGETRSYADIAAAVGKPKAVRAVGTANGMNRLAILIPCHRVIGADGALTGYGGGLWRKDWLLKHEHKY